MDIVGLITQLLPLIIVVFLLSSLSAPAKKAYPQLSAKKTLPNMKPSMASRPATEPEEPTIPRNWSYERFDP